MKIVILDEAERDLINGYHFYERQSRGVGGRFLACIFQDIDGLPLFPGRHPVIFGKHRMLATSFPFGIYYLVRQDQIEIHAVLDMRSDPAWLRSRL